METIQKLHGNPKIIVSERDPIFTGNFWKKLFSCLGTQLAHSSSYHPQSDGKTEIVNKCLEGYLRCFVSDKQTQWVKWLLGPYNTSDYPITMVVVTLINILCPYCPHIIITMPHRIPLLLFLWLYIIIVRLVGLYCDSLDSYI